MIKNGILILSPGKQNYLLNPAPEKMLLIYGPVTQSIYRRAMSFFCLYFVIISYKTSVF